MKWNKVILLFALPFVAQLTMAVCCCDNDVPPPPNPSSLCPADSMSLVILENTGNEPVVVESDTVNKEAFGIRMILISTNKAPYCYRQPAPRSLFTTANALACDCDPYPYPVVDTVSRIIDFSIYTVNLINQEYPANSEVTDLFMYRRGSNVERINSDRFSISDTADFLLMEFPDSSLSAQFMVSLVFSDAKELVATTKLTYLNEK